MSDDAIAKAAIAEGMEDDLVKAASRDLAILAIKKVHHYLEYGTPQFQMAIIRTFISSMVRETMKVAGDDENAELKKAFEQLRKDMLEGVPGSEDYVDP